MELVYLWVEDYKNIHKQGFNFSPRFHCEFFPEYEKDENGNEKLKENCKLEIKEKKDYIPDFFGENINITAIVGKNGSGKSSIIESLLKIRKTLIDNNDKQSGMDGFIVFESDDELNIYSNKKIEITSNNIKQSNQYFKDKILSTEKIVFSWLNALHKTKIEENYYIQRNNPSLQFNAYELDRRHLLVIKKFSDLLRIVDDKYYFDTVRINFLQSKRIFPEEYDFFDNGLKNFIRNSYSEEIASLEKFSAYNMLISLVNYFIRNREIISGALNIYPIELFNRFIPLFSSYNNYNNYKEFAEKYMKFLNSISEDISKIENDDIKIIYSEIQIIKTKVFFLQNFLNLNLDFNLDKSKDSFFNLLHIHSYTKKINMYDNLEELLDILENFTKLNDIKEFRFCEIEIINKQTNISYSNLSDGEKQIFSILIDVIYVLSDTLWSDNQVIILDEVDAYLHPSWMKELLSILIKLVSEFNRKYEAKNIHLLMVTHSPFILSDIPKQNVLFLNRDRNGDCKVVDGLKEKKETFGANIHTLLSDSFFMEDGLMGEFSKKKISHIKQFYEKVIKYKEKPKCREVYKKIYIDKKQKEFWQIQKIIGEPFIQKIVQNQLEEIELILLGKNVAIDKEIRRLQALKESFTNG